MQLVLQCVLNHLSYGQVGYNFSKELANKVDLRILPIARPDRPLSKEMSESISKGVSYNKESPCLKIWHEFDLFNRPTKGIYYAMPIFEVNKFPDQSIESLKKVDRIIVNSTWAQAVIQDQVGVNSDVVPLGVDTSIYKVMDVPKRRPYVFLHIGKMERRKNQDKIIKAFDMAFKYEDVELWLMWQNNFLNDKQREYYNQLVNESSSRNKIRIVQPAPNSTEVARIINMADCGVFPSSAEGFCLPALECLACGKQLITTNYSAMPDYCNDSNSFLLKDLKQVPSIDPDWPQFNGNSTWASINVAELAHYMNEAYKRGKTLNEEGIKTAESFTWEKSTERLLHVLKA